MDNPHGGKSRDRNLQRNRSRPSRSKSVEMLDEIKDALQSSATFTWLSADFLQQQKVQAWSDMPVWAGDELGLARTKIDRALAKGLTFRPLAETAP